MKKMLTKGVSLILVLMLLILTGCGSSQPDTSTNQNANTNVVKIGVIEPFSGKDALNGQTMRYAYQYAVDKINAGGGIKSLGGAKLEIAWGDHQSKQDVAMSEVERLINTEKVSVLAGAELSGITMAATQVAERMRVPFVVDVPAAAAITERGFKYTFRSNISAVDYGTTFIDFLDFVKKTANLETKTTAIFYEDTEIGKSVMDSARKKMEAKGYEIVFDQAHLSGLQDATTHASKIKAANPDVLLMNDTGPDAVMVTKGLAAIGTKPKMIITADGGYELPYWKEKVGDLSNDWIEMVQYNDDLPGMKELAEDYKKVTGDQLNGHSALGMQVTYIIKEALEKAASAEPQKIRDALDQLVIEKGNESLIMPWSKVDFNEKGQNEGALNIVVQWQDGKLVTVFPEGVASGKARVPANYFAK